MSIVESGGPPSWSLDVSETGESTNCLWIGVMGFKAWIFLVCRALHHPYPWAFCTLSPVSLASRDQDGGMLDSTIDIYDLTEK